MRYLTVSEILDLHKLVLEQSGGADGFRDLGAVESAVAQPQITFGGQELCPTVAEKASALGFSLVMNHPFIDGNKRVGHAAMETFLVLNGYELSAAVDEQERIVLQVASGDLGRAEFTEWGRSRMVERKVES
jgi:death on curing protein